MRKLFVWVLALLTLLHASAELADGFPAVTVTGELTVDLNAAREAMEDAGLLTGPWIDILSHLSGTRDALVIADEGIEYHMARGEDEVLSVAAEVREGRVSIVSSAFPGYVLTREASNTSWQAVADATEEVMQALGQTLEAVTAAMVPGTPELGSFEVEGERFDMRIPIDVDAAAMAAAGAALWEQLQWIEALGVAPMRFDPAEPPAVAAARYSADGASATLYTATLTPAQAGLGDVLTSVRLDGDDVRVRVALLEKAFELTGTYAPGADGAALRLDAAYNGTAYALTVDARAGAMTTALYVNDMERPVATEVNTFALSGERTLAVDAEGKTPLALQDVFDNRDGAATRLLADLLVNAGL